jgi:hypothetical protein
MVMACAGGSASAATHTFDATLSLTGGCTTSSLDPIPDPGCPDQSSPQSFSSPRAIATDAYGDVYVASYGNGAEGRIDVFSAQGVFLTELSDPSGPVSLAVDSEGNLYVFGNAKTPEVHRFSPTVYEPAVGNIAYDGAASSVMSDFGTSLAAIAVDPSNDHLFVHHSNRVLEFSSAATGNTLLDDTIGQGILTATRGVSLAVDSARNRLYVSDEPQNGLEGLIRVFELEAPHDLVATFYGSDTPNGKISTQPSLAADEQTGHLFIYDGSDNGSNVVYELTADGNYLASISYGIKDIGAAIQIWVDNGAASPNGALNPEGRYLFVPSHPAGVGHSLAYGPSGEEPPTIESTRLSDVTESEAQVIATINSGGLATSYAVEYASESEGPFVIASTGQLQALDTGVPVTASLTGLLPGVTYRVRVTASNSEGTDATEGNFTTYNALDANQACSNSSLRVGASALLPDCRAYELVTPADTNARTPVGVGHFGVYFASPQAAAAGNKVSFQIEGGSIPGADGTGSFAGDPYLATREANGWTSSNAGPDGGEAPKILPGSTSPDQGYSFWSTASPQGGAAVEGENAHYVRYPDGHNALVGRGSLGSDPAADGKLISENGSHIVFVSGAVGSGAAVQLEPDAPADGTRTVYDRTADEVTHVVSLLPGDETPDPGHDASYVGASADGLGVAFTIDGVLYLRYNNQRTFEVGPGLTFAGIAEGGKRIFYLQGGSLKAFDVEAGVLVFSAGGSVIPVNISASGTAAYFVSQFALVKTPNPLGDKPKAGLANLYLSREGEISFIGIVTDRDVEGEFSGVEQIDGLGLWLEAVGPGSAELPGRLGIDPSRTTPDGNVLLFESRANLTGYDSAGHAEVYRYDSVHGQLTCLSCNPTGASPSGNASLQSISAGIAQPEPFGAFAVVENLRADGRRAFFQSPEPLVVDDTDGLQDVYEWEDEGVGTCTRAGGCVYLISSGQSDRVDYLYAVSATGDDVFFRSSDLLLPSDQDETPSIYDARVEGGFPESRSTSCEGEGCRPVLPSSPNLAVPDTAPKGKKVKCAKSKRRVKRHGKVRCVKKHRRHPHRASPKKKGASK